MSFAIVFAVLFLVYAIRGHWVYHQSARYTLLATYWCVVTKQGVIVADEMSQTWGYNYLMFEWWHWDWRRYLVYRGHYDEMMEWMMSEVTRPDLNWDAYTRASTPQAPVEAAADGKSADAAAPKGDTQ